MELLNKLTRPNLRGRLQLRTARYGRQVDLKFATKLGRLANVHASSSEKCDPSLRGIIAETTSDEVLSLEGPSPYHWGSARQRERISQVAELNIQRYEGDLIEIGAFKGETTKLLCEVARVHSRRVIVVDPWQTGTQDCDGGEFQTFLQNVAPYLDLLDVIRASSMDPKVISEIAKRTLAFAFVDGHHSYEACLSDIRAVRHTLGMIAVDDLIMHPGIWWGDAVNLAFRRGATGIGRIAIGEPWMREGYLIRPENRHQ
jgi:Methyltransferase domain